MRHGRRLARRTSAQLAVVVLAALAVAGVLIGAGSAFTTVKNSGAQFVPPTAAAGAAATYTLALTNKDSSNTTLGSVNVSVPTGFGVDGSSLANDRGWSNSLNTSAGVIELRAGTSKKALAPGQTLTVTFTATAPCASTAAPVVWTTFVKQSNNFNGTGNDFVVDPQPSVTITGGAAAAGFSFDTISSPQAVGAPFGITVRARDACGNDATSFNGTAQLTGLTNVAASTLSFSSGVATSTVTAVATQAGAQLTATSGSVTGSSNAFDVVHVVCTSSSASCVASDDAGETSVQAPVPQGSAKLAITFGDTGSGCVSNLIGSTITLDPIGYTSATSVTFEWDKSVAPGTGVANFVLCWSKPDQPSAVLPTCVKKNPQGTCELSRNRDHAGDLLIVVRLDPEDPDFELG